MKREERLGNLDAWAVMGLPDVSSFCFGESLGHGSDKEHFSAPPATQLVGKEDGKETSDHQKPFDRRTLVSLIGFILRVLAIDMGEGLFFPDNRYAVLERDRTKQRDTHTRMGFA